MSHRPPLAKHQPCGCVICTCENEEQCTGCGAKNCGTHPVGELPNPVFDPEPLPSAFNIWWHNEGSAMGPEQFPNLDHCEHVRHVAAIAWQNGEYVSRLNTEAGGGMNDNNQMHLPLACDLPEEYRFAENADGTPALRVCVILDEISARKLNEWFSVRVEELKALKWQGWGIAESVVRTLCVQIDAFSRRTFGMKGGGA